MSVRFDADGEDFITTTNSLSTPFTLLCWAMLSVDRNTFQTVFQADDGGSPPTTVVNLQTNSDGTSMGLWDKFVETVTGPAMTVGTWYRFAVTHSGTTLTLYYGIDSGSLTSATGTQTIAGNLPTLRIGESVWGGEWLNGRIAGFKQYSAVLTQTEIETELASATAVRTSGLYRHHQFATANTADDSGNSRTLTGGVGATTEADPPFTPPVASSLRLPIQTIQVP